MPVPIASLNMPGKYVAAFNSHFIALQQRDGELFLNEEHRTHAWTKVSISGHTNRAIAWHEDHAYINPNFFDAVYRLEARLRLIARA